jgi:hypothetical protein
MWYRRGIHSHRGGNVSIFGKKPTSGPVAPGSPPDDPATAPPPTRPPTATYGVDNAVRLMRTLPFDTNPELVALVLKNTLESVNVSVDDILRDAHAKAEAIRQQIATLHAEITLKEEELADLRKRVGACDAEMAEVIAMRGRLDPASAPRSARPSDPRTEPPKVAAAEARGQPAKAPPPSPQSQREVVFGPSGRRPE